MVVSTTEAASAATASAAGTGTTGGSTTKRPKRKNLSIGTSNDDSLPVDFTSVTCLRVHRKKDSSNAKLSVNADTRKSDAGSRAGKSRRQGKNDTSKAATASSSDAEPTSRPSNLLQRLLGPSLDDKIFLNQCFRECAVHVQGHATASRHGDATNGNQTDEDEPDGTTPFGDILPELDDLEVADILQQTSSENIFVWLQPAAAAAAITRTPSDDPRHRQRIHSIEVSDPESALHLYQAGHTVYCRAPPSIERKLVSSLLADTGLGCGQYDPTGSRLSTLGRGEVEVFIGSTAGHVTGWHYDFQENFTLQVSGVKKWTLCKGAVRNPIRACTPHYNSPGTVESQLLAARLSNPNFGYANEPSSETSHNTVGDELETVTLHPGDVFYFPAGMWHKVEVVEPGLSLNVSLMAATFASVTCQALQHVLLQRDDWRQCIQHSDHANINAVEHLKQLLVTLPDMIRELSQEAQLAQAILPPVLRQPSAAAAGTSNDDDDEDEDEDNDGEMAIVHVPSFVPLPESSSLMNPKDLDQWLKTHILLKNPLAVLLNEKDEVHACYKVDSQVDHDEDDDNMGDEDTEIFILNVNFAGNETHESSIRVRLAANADSIRAIQGLFASTSNSKGADTNGDKATALEYGVVPSDAAWLSAHLRHVDCLVHFGYLIWNARS